MFARALLQSAPKGARRAASTAALAREHKGVVLSRAEIGGKIYTRIRDTSPDRLLVYLHEADPLNPRSPGIDAKEGDAVEFNLDDNLRPISVLSKTGGTTFAADLFKERIPPPSLSDALAPVSQEIVRVLETPDEVTDAALETVENYLNRTGIRKKTVAEEDPDSLPFPLDSEDDLLELLVLEDSPALYYPKYISSSTATFSEPLGLDVEKVTQELTTAGVDPSRIPFVLEALIRNRELTFLEFGHGVPERPMRLESFRDLFYRLDHADEFVPKKAETDPKDEVGASLLFLGETDDIKEDLLADFLNPNLLNPSSPSSTSAPSEDPLAVFKATAKK